MKQIMPFLTVMFCLWATVACGDDASELAEKLSDWKAAKTKADSQLLKTFDRQIGLLKKTRELSPEVRNAKIKLLKDQMGHFQNDGELPNYDNMLPATIQYLDTLHQAALPLRKWFDMEMEEVVGTGKKFDILAAAKEKWQSDLPSRDDFVSRTAFHGTRTFRSGRTIDFHIHVWNIENNSFAGEIWKDVNNVSGKAGWQHEAKLEGNQFVLSTRKMLHGGGSRQLVFRGYVIGRRVLMTLTHKNGQPLTGDLISMWKK